MSKLNFNEILLTACISTDDCGEICTAIKDKKNGNTVIANDIDEDYESLLLSTAKMYAMLERAKEVMLRTYDVTDYPANGNTDCDKCAAEIDALLAKTRGES